MNIRRPMYVGLLSAMVGLGLPASANPVAGQGTWETTLQARDINRDGVIDAYFDTTLGISWLAITFAKGPPPGDFPPHRPIFTANEAQEWAGAQDIYGVTGWRLPKVINIIGGAGMGRGYCAEGHNPRLCGPNPDPALSELAHMYYVTLGNTALIGDRDASFVGGLSNTGPFQDLIERTYWTHTVAEPSDFVWGFDMRSGTQYPVETIASRQFGAWAVHDGDVAPVPEPGTTALMGSGLALLGLLARRRKNSAR